MKRLASAAFSILLVGVVITAVALEISGVVTVHTETAAGANRTTHVWFVEEDGTLYLEAGNPQNPWVVDLIDADELRLSGQDLDGRYRFMLHTSAESHQRIRQMMRDKYGWRDVWIGMLFDTSASRMMELSRMEGT